MAIEVNASLFISMSFGLGPLALLLSDPKQQKDLCCLSEFPHDASLCLPATGWGDKYTISSKKMFFLCLQKYEMWDSHIYLLHRKVSQQCLILYITSGTQ